MKIIRSIAASLCVAVAFCASVMAQEVKIVEPEAVVTGRDGFLRVFYRKLGLKLQTYDEWVASGARMPSTKQITH